MVARRRRLQHGRRHLHHEQDRDHQGLRRPWTLPTPSKIFTVIVAAATFVTFWAIWTAFTWQPPIEARLRALRTRRMKTRSEQAQAKLAQVDVDRLHALARRPPEPAARRGGRPDDAQAAPGRLHVARRHRRLHLHQARPAAGAGLCDDPADLDLEPDRRAGQPDPADLHGRRARGLPAARALRQERRRQAARGPDPGAARGARPPDDLRRSRPQHRCRLPPGRQGDARPDARTRPPSSR